MYFLDTQMHMVTFSITAFEMVILFFQVIHFLQRTNDKKRLLYLILLIFLILHNICSGLFPDEKFVMPIMAQNVVAYLVAFCMSMYVVYYFYKAFDLKELKFFATYGILVFLLLPCFLLFIVPYSLTGDLKLSRQLTVVIPFIFGLSFIYSTARAFIIKYKKSKTSLDTSLEYPFDFVVTAFLALICWGVLPVIVFFGDFQVLEHSVTNAGFLMMTVIYIRTSIQQSRKEYEVLLLSAQSRQELFELNCKKHNLTPREVDVVSLIIKGQSYKFIGYTLKISEKTVARHVSNMFAKVSATNKVDLINLLEGRTPGGTR